MEDFKQLSQLSSGEVAAIRMMRWKARTDLGFLCREILNYPDVHDPVHTPIMNILQKFPVPTKEQFYENDQIVNGRWKYTPIQRMTSLPGKRRRLILDPRGWLKTTINAQSHTIQWILNYPDVAILIFQSNLDKAEMILGEIKKHFQFNPMFRQLFPEHCPTKSISEWGTKGMFSSNARGQEVTRKEATVMTSSIDAGTAGMHFEVMKFSDIVEPSNTGTAQQMENVTKSFYMSENLLIGPNYWMDVEGTRYDFGDTYGRIIDSEKGLAPEKKRWLIHARGCYIKNIENPQFTPAELELPNKVDDKGEFILHWNDADRGFTFENYEAKRRDDPYIFSCQAENSPAGGVDGRTIFPIIPKVYPVMIRRKDFTDNVRISHYVATVDTAETTGTRSNYSCITVAGFASDGKVYVNEIIHGKFLPNELVQKICDLVKPVDAARKIRPFFYGPQLRAIKIEETAFVRGLIVGLNTYQHLQGIHLPIQFIKRDNQVSKIERIQNSLQPAYTSGRLIFLDDIGPWEHLLQEIRQFPKSQTDDILDTMADIFQGKEWFGREIPKLSMNQFKSQAMARMLGTESPWDPDDRWLTTDGTVPTHNNYWDKTGGL